MQDKTNSLDTFKEGALQRICFTQTMEGAKLLRVSKILRLPAEVAITSTKFTLEIGRQQLKDNNFRASSK